MAEKPAPKKTAASTTDAKKAEAAAIVAAAFAGGEQIGATTGVVTAEQIRAKAAHPAGAPTKPAPPAKSAPPKSAPKAAGGAPPPAAPQPTPDTTPAPGVDFSAVLEHITTTAEAVRQHTAETIGVAVDKLREEIAEALAVVTKPAATPAPDPSAFVYVRRNAPEEPEWLNDWVDVHAGDFDADTLRCTARTLGMTEMCDSGDGEEEAICVSYGLEDVD